MTYFFLISSRLNVINFAEPIRLTWSVTRGHHFPWQLKMVSYWNQSLYHEFVLSKVKMVHLVNTCTTNTTKKIKTKTNNWNWSFCDYIFRLLLQSPASEVCDRVSHTTSIRKLFKRIVCARKAKHITFVSN